MEPKFRFMREQAAAHLDLPRDLAFGDTRITMMGNSSLSIENYRHLYAYSSTLIQVCTRSGMLHIVGEKLQIRYYTQEEMQIAGFLKELLFAAMHG